MVAAPFAFSVLLRHSRERGNPYAQRARGIAAVPQDCLPCVYILASGKHGTLYIGVTSNLLARLHQHREGLIEGFTSRYGVNRLVYFEMSDDMLTAIAREKQLKKWRRAWKIELIEEANPGWIDLAIGLGFDPAASSAVLMDPRVRGDDEEAGTE
jgi:putative endonuclease